VIQKFLRQFLEATTFCYVNCTVWPINNPQSGDPRING